MNFKLIILACLLAAAQSRFIKPFMSGRIIGGQDADPGKHPYQVSLQIGLPPIVQFTHFCGGTILNERWILTAQHCLEPKELSDFPFFVSAGRHNLNETEESAQMIFVEAFYMHDKPNSSLDFPANDLGLIKLSKPLVFNSRVAAASLPKKDSDPTGEVILSGWGAVTNDTKDPKYPSILQTVTVPIIDRDTCNEAIEKIGIEAGLEMKDLVHEKNICTGPLVGGVSACTGDSGGPVISKGADGKSEVVGVASWTLVPCGRKGAPTVFVRVASYIDWITNTIAKN